MDLATQARVVGELSKLAEEFDCLVGALVQATQRGLVVSNLRQVVLEHRDVLAHALEGTT